MEKTSLLTTFVLHVLLTVVLKCDAQDGYTINAVVGEDVVIACGVQVKGPRTRLLWKYGPESVELGYSYDGSVSCDITKKDSCSLRQDGSLVLRNVQETDSDDYYCEVDGEKYYSQHSLVIHPEVSPPEFEVCPSSEDVFVADTGPQEMVLAYTSPACRNTDVVGNVACDPPSGAKIGINHTEIVCTCTHSGNTVDSCMIPVPDVPPSFENCPGSDSVSVSKSGQSSLTLLAYTNPVCRNSKDVIGYVSCDPPSGAEIHGDTKIVCTCIHSGSTADTCKIPIPAVNNACGCPHITGLGIFTGILMSALGVTIGIAVWCMYKRKQSKNDTQNGVAVESGKVTRNEEGNEMSPLNAENSRGELGKVTRNEGENKEGEERKSVNPTQKREELANNQDSSPGFGMLESGQPFASVTETDGNMQGAIKDSHPQFGGMKELVVEGHTPKFRILPSVVEPSDGIELESQFHSNLDIYLHDKDGVPIPNITFEQQRCGLSTNVAELVTLPVHITCGKCRESCCLLEVYGDEYSKKEEKSYCMESV